MLQEVIPFNTNLCTASDSFCKKCAQCYKQLLQGITNTCKVLIIIFTVKSHIGHIWIFITKANPTIDMCQECYTNSGF